MLNIGDRAPNFTLKDKNGNVMNELKFDLNRI